MFNSFLNKNLNIIVQLLHLNRIIKCNVLINFEKYMIHIFLIKQIFIEINLLSLQNKIKK